MATRKPLVIGDNNLVAEIDDGDTIGGVPLAIPFYLTDGTFQPIPLTSQAELPFYLSDGTPFFLSTVVA